MQARPFEAAKGAKAKREPLCPSLSCQPHEMEADLAALAGNPSLAEPCLPDGAGGGGKHALPPPPPPPLRGAVVDVPPALRPLFGGGSGGQLLQRLLRQAVAELPTALALAAPHSGGSKAPQADSGQQAAETLVVGGDIDFGTVPVCRLTAAQLVDAAAAAAAGLPADAASSSSSSLGAAAAGSLLDLLHLASAPQQQQQPASSVAEGSQMPSAGGGGTALGGSAASPSGPVLHFRQLVMENRSVGDELWLLGGIAAPSFPHTLAAIDDARLFWLDGGLPWWGEGAAACWPLQWCQ